MAGEMAPSIEHLPCKPEDQTLAHTQKAGLRGDLPVIPAFTQEAKLGDYWRKMAR